MRSTQIKQSVRNQQKTAEEKRRRDYAEKLAKARENCEEKVLQQDKARMEHE